MTTLAEELPKQMARVRDELVPIYQSVGPAGSFALAMMRAELDRAANAMAQGDTVAMIRSCEALKNFEA